MKNKMMILFGLGLIWAGTLQARQRVEMRGDCVVSRADANETYNAIREGLDHFPLVEYSCTNAKGALTHDHALTRPVRLTGKWRILGELVIDEPTGGYKYRVSSYQQEGEQEALVKVVEINTQIVPQGIFTKAEVDAIVETECKK